MHRWPICSKVNGVILVIFAKETEINYCFWYDSALDCVVFVKLKTRGRKSNLSTISKKKKKKELTFYDKERDDQEKYMECVRKLPLYT